VSDGLAAAACAIGIELTAASASAAATDDPPPHLLLLGLDSGLDSGWQAVDAHAGDATLVVGLQWRADGGGGGGAHAFISSRAHALAWHLAADAPDALEGVACSTCDAAAHALLNASCDLRTYFELVDAQPDGDGGPSAADAGAAARVVHAVMETVAGTTAGRVADRCDDVAELLGVEGVRALCRAHGCEK